MSTSIAGQTAGSSSTGRSAHDVTVYRAPAGVSAAAPPTTTTCSSDLTCSSSSRRAASRSAVVTRTRTSQSARM